MKVCSHFALAEKTGKKKGRIIKAKREFEDLI
jgi:hypothetical protein